MANRVNRERLRHFLFEEKECKNVAVMSTLEPFFKIAENGRFPLLKAEELKEEEIKEGLNSIGLIVEKILFVSRKDPAWMAEESYHDFLKKHTETDFEVHFWDSLESPLEKNLASMLWENLLFYLWSDLWSSLEGCSGEVDLRLFGGFLYESLFCFLAFSLTNEKDKAEKLRILLDLFTRSLIFGRKKDEPTAWLVMVA